LATLELTRPVVNVYPCNVEFKAICTGLKPTEYVSYDFKNNHPESVVELLKNPSSAKYRIYIKTNSNITITCTATVYEIGVNGEKNTVQTLVGQIDLYETTLERPYEYDVLPYAPTFDRSYQYTADLSALPLAAVLWAPEDAVFELPYYIPVKVNVSGGVPPYTYNWYVTNVGATKLPYTLYARHNVCSLVFPQTGMFIVRCVVTDSKGDSVTCEGNLRVLPSVEETKYRYDMPPAPDYFDGTLVVARSWSPSSLGLSKNNNFYSGFFRMQLDFSTVSVEEFLARVQAVVNQTMSADQMWERYYASGCNAYKSLENRASVYYGGRMSLQNLYVEEDNTLGFNIKVTTDYPVTSALARLHQAIRWVCATSNIPFTVLCVNDSYRVTPVVKTAGVVDGLKTYLETLASTRYQHVELDDLFASIQNDVDRYLSMKNEYTAGGLDGNPYHT